MHKISEYLMQSQGKTVARGTFRLLETRGAGRAALSPLYLLRAMGLVLAGHISGRLAGVHVNSAERLSLMRKVALLGFCRIVGVPTVLHLHAAQLPAMYASLPRSGRALVRRAFSWPECVIALGDTAARFVTGELHVQPAKVRIVINGVPEPVVPRRKDGRGDVFRLLFVGNLSDRKGVPDLLRALTEPSLAGLRLQLVIAGGGEVAGYQAIADRLGVSDRVNFLGWTAKPDLDRELAMADAFILPSYDEGLPLAILEALSQGVPVICTPVGEIPQFLDGGTNALFVPAGDTQAIAAAIAGLAADPARAESLGRAGRSLYEERFSLERFAASIFAIHEQCFRYGALRAK
jgi:glycosyltransferase involved in cell wall biosynthesis